MSARDDHGVVVRTVGLMMLLRLVRLLGLILWHWLQQLLPLGDLATSLWSNDDAGEKLLADLRSAS